MKTPTSKLEIELTTTEYFDLLSAVLTRQSQLELYIESIPGEGDKSVQYSSASELERLQGLEAKIRESHMRETMPFLYSQGVRL